MSDTPMWRRYLRFFRPDAAAVVDDELTFHLEMRTEELIAKGMAPEAARAEALRRMPDLRGVKRACRRIDEGAERATRRREWLAITAQEARRGARSLRRSPGFTLMAGLTLARGIGATTAIFTLLDAVVLSPLPYPEAERVPGVQVTASLMHVLRLQPMLGTLLTQANDQPGAAPAAVLSHGFWLRCFGGHPHIIGQVMTIGYIPAWRAAHVDPTEALRAE